MHRLRIYRRFRQERGQCLVALLAATVVLLAVAGVAQVPPPTVKFTAIGAGQLTDADGIALRSGAFGDPRTIIAVTLARAIGLIVFPGSGSPGLLLDAAAGDAEPTIGMFPLPVEGTRPNHITLGPDGNFWFTEFVPSNNVGRITPEGIITEFTAAPVAGPFSGLGDITAGPDGAVWFTAGVNNQIGRIDTTTNALLQFSIPTRAAGLTGIILGPDGALWFTEQAAKQIGRITREGSVTENPIPSGSLPFFIATGADGNLWFTQSVANSIARMTTAGMVDEFPIPTSNGQPQGITAGPDGAVWFTEALSNQIGRVGSDGTITEFPVPTANSLPSGIVSGPAGDLFVAEFAANQIAHIEIVVPPACVGDCSGERRVTVDELITMVDIALGTLTVSACPAGDGNRDGHIAIDEILRAVHNSLDGCPAV